MRQRTRWDYKDFAHWFLMFDKKTADFVLDLLYYPNVHLQLLVFGYGIDKKDNGIYVPPIGMIYPTSLMGSREFSEIIVAVMTQEVALLNPKGIDRKSKKHKWFNFWRK